jgi:epoxyqueuosine reductase
MQPAIMEALTGQGYHVRAIPYRHVGEIRELYTTLHDNGTLTPDVYDYVIQYIDFQPPAEMPEPASVIILAIGNRPHRTLSFQWKGRQVSTVLPNAYIPGIKKREEAWEDVGQALAGYGYRWVRASLPQKTLAVRSGLARYGRNNISYVEGLGNFHRIMVFYTDMPCTEDPWQESRMLDRCQSCRACQKACPTGAISGDRFLIHAERCVTFFNEKEPDVRFPDWMRPEMHTCLAGCLECQKICPENRSVMQYVEGDKFNEDETTLFLKGVTINDLPEGMREKVERSELQDVLDVLPRNLQVLLS